MINLSIDAIFIYLFYGLASILIYAGFYMVTAEKWIKSWIFAWLIVIVSSEYWEIPIFFMAYLGAPGYGAPNIYNHLIVGIIALVLLAFSRFHLDLKNGAVLVLILVVDSICLLAFPGVVPSFLLRAFCLSGLSWIFLREVERHE